MSIKEIYTKQISQISNKIDIILKSIYNFYKLFGAEFEKNSMANCYLLYLSVGRC